MKREVDNRPIDIPTDETAAFITSQIIKNGSILEVGCGDGHVAAKLQARGFPITGIDDDPDAVKRAKARGINAKHGCWPDVELETFDAVAFTRSLHHIANLAAAVNKASITLNNKGILLLEDFAFNVTDNQTMDWFMRLLNSESISSLIHKEPDEFVTRMLAADDQMLEWRNDKHHELHSAEAMTNAIADEFEIVFECSVPYFYRYLVPVFPETSEAAVIVSEVLAEEKRLGAAGEIELLGRRIVGVMKND